LSSIFIAAAAHNSPSAEEAQPFVRPGAPTLETVVGALVPLGC